jgi:nitroreductase
VNGTFCEMASARHAVREFRPDPVPREVLERIVLAAASAPSSENEQPWRFYLTSNETRQRLGTVVGQSTSYLAEYLDVLSPEAYDRAVSWFTSLGDAPVLVAIATPDSTDDFKLVNRLLSVGAALENLLLAATEEGLGACPFTFSFWVKDQVAEVLGVPDGESVVCIVALGWPTDAAPLVRPKRSDVAVWLD